MKASIFVLFFSLVLISVNGVTADYGLNIGTKAPNFTANKVPKGTIQLSNEVKDQNVVLVFYRGGWCPFCNIQLRELQNTLAPELKSLNAKLIAVSVDLVDEGVKTTEKNSLSFDVVSDPKAKILKAYNIAYKVPEELVKKYKESYGLDLEKSSGEKHHIIAVPSVFVIDKTQTIKFSYSNEDYKTRAQIKDILAALRSLK
ncbi:MAG: AhpC/TSA family protein [Bdellovibrionales bacterium]|nr:AhpC/TSA family protein [Bdellovibrionales bacterium]